MKIKSFNIFLLLSLIIHLLFFSGVSIFSSSRPKNNYVSIDYISQEKPSPEKKAPSDIQTPLKQIVDQGEKPLNHEENKNAKYLSKHTQSVAKETVAKNRGEFKNSKGLAPGPQNPAPVNKPAAQKRLPFDPLGDSKQAFKSKALETIAGETPSNPTTAGGASQTQDYLKDAHQGVETLLNTKEFKYYTYFNRIRKQLSQHWEPKVRDKLTKMFRQGRTIASDQDRITKLLIVLDPAGILVKVQIVSDSGVRDLDDAAIEAFKSAAPFPNPPRGIVDPDGTVKIRWDFILES